MAAADEEASTGRPAGGVSEALPCRGCGCVDRDDGPAEVVPEWRGGLDAERASRIDVRPILAAGEPPLGAVIQLAGAVAPGGVLLIEAPFDPQPLRRLLAGKEFATYGERLGPGHWRIWCRRRGDSGDRRARAEDRPTEAMTWRAGDVVHIDVRGLEAPRPLVAILALIDGGSHQGHVVVHHNREPLYLYPELDDRGWSYARLPSPEGEVRLELQRPTR